MSSTIDVIRAGLIARGIPAYGETYGLTADPTTLTGDALARLIGGNNLFVGKDAAALGLTGAKTGMLPYTGRCDTLLLTPENHSIATAFDWSLNNTNIAGMAPGGLGLNKRARIGHSATLSPFITVSGYGNSFSDIYTMHGMAATDYIGWLISGARNLFSGMHFGGPMFAAQGGHASYNGMNITGSENVFTDCIFGTNTIERDELTPNVTLGPGTLTIFNNCTFLCALTDTDPYFVAVANTSGYTEAYFNNCKFRAFSSNQANKCAVAFTFSGSASADVHLDQLCSFSGVTHLAVTGSMKYIWAPTVFAATADELNLLAINTGTF